MAEPNTPGQIDVRLVGQSELTSLQAAIKEMASSITTFAQGSAELRNVAERQMASQMGEQLRQTPTGTGSVLFETAPGARSQGASTPFGGGTATPTDEYEPVTARETFEQLADDKEARRKLAEGEIFEPQGRWQQFLARTLPDSYEQQVATAKAGQLGPSAGASRGGMLADPNMVPTGMPSPGFGGDIDPNAAIWQHHANEMGLGQRIAIPQYGEWTTQNKVFMAAQGLNWAANRRKDALEAEPGAITQGLGQTGATIGRFAVSAMPGLTLAGGLAMGQADSPGLLGINARPAELLRQYEQAGVSGAGGTVQDLGPLGEPFRQIGWNFDLPAPLRMLMTDAGREALKDWPKRFAERRKHAGFTGDDETALQNFMAGEGVLGRDQEHENEFRSRAAQLLSRDWGVGAEEISAETRVQMFGRVARQQGLGNSNLNDFENVIRGIDEAAKSAHISGQEFADQLIQLQEHFESIGGTATSGLEAGRAFSSATGAMPGTMAAALQNPLVQGNLSLRSGMLPQTLGTLPAGQLTQGIIDTAKMYRGAFSGITDKPQEVRDPKTGEVIGVNNITARSQIDALTAHALDIPVSEYRVMMRNARRAERVTPIQSAIEGWSQSIRQTGKGTPERRALLRDTTSPDIISGRDIVRMMENSKIGTREQRGHLRELMNESPRKARQMAEKMLNQYVGADEYKDKGRGNIEVDLSDRAARYLEMREKDEKKTERARNRSKRNKGATPDFTGADPDFPAHPGAGGWQTADLRSGTHSRPSDFEGIRGRPG